MSTMELTHKIEMLSEEDFKVVAMLVDRLTAQTDVLKRYSEEELIEELSRSIEKSDAGYTKSAEAFSGDMRVKYAI